MGCFAPTDFYLLSVVTSSSSVAQTDTATIAVDFTQTTSVNSMSGFLIGNQLSSCASQNMLTPLAPKLIRGENPNLSNPVFPGVTHHYLTSNIWGFPPAFAQSGIGMAPYDSLSLFYTKVADIAIDFSIWGFDSVIVFDIWNEPNSPAFWDGTELQYHQTFKTAVNAIRSILPNARIAGPSTASFDTTMIKNLLDYCVANSIKFDVLSWHELLGDIVLPGDTSNEIREVKDHLLYAQLQYLNNPTYASIGLQEIHINEFVGQSDQYLPGEYLAYLSALELGGANLASHACWNAINTSSNCNNCTLDGFVEQGTWQPRSKWWVNKIYADNVSDRVTSASSNTAIVSLAAKNSVDAVSILIGHNRQTKTPNGNYNIKLNLSNLPFSNQVQVQVKSIPNQDETVLTNPIIIYDSTLAISGNSLSLILDTIPLHDVWYVTMINTNPLSVENQFSEQDNIKVYPNPFDDYATVEYSNFNGQWNWTMYNSIGQKIQQINNINSRKLIIKKGELKNGIYFYQINSNTEIIASGKIVISSN